MSTVKRPGSHPRSHRRINSALASRHVKLKWAKLKWTLLATAPVAAAFWINPAFGQTATWDSSGTNPGAPTDGPGLWDSTTSAKWSSGGVDVVWPNGDVAQFGSANGAAGTVTIDDGSGTVTAAGINFNPAGSGNYTIGAVASDSLTLSGTGAINVASGLNPTISAPIAGVGLTMTGPGTLNLTGNNTYSGPTAINSGTLVVGPGGSLGASTNALTIGQVAVVSGTTYPATTPGNLAVNNNVTVGSLAVQTNSSTANTLAIGAGNTLSVGGAFSVGLTPPTATVTGTAPTLLTVTGSTGSLAVSTTGSANFAVAPGAASTTPAVNITDTLDMTGLQSFTYGNSSNSGELVVGVGNHATGVLKLAQNSTITENDIRVGDSASVFNGSVQNGGATSTLALGSGTTTITTNSIVVGAGKGQGSITFASGTGSLVITGNEAGSAGTALTLGTGVSGSSSTSGTLNLNGHLVNANFSTMDLGHRTSSGTLAGVGASGIFSFDDGVVTTTGVTIAHLQSGGTIANFASGTINVGSVGNTNTATLNITGTGSQNLANDTGGSSNTTATGFINVLPGGTVNSNGNFTTSISGTNNSATYTVTVAGGTLNMNSHALSGSGTLITTGGEIDAISSIATGGGVTMNTAGNTLAMGGGSRWFGATNISAGTAVLLPGASLGDTTVTVSPGAAFIANGGTSIGVTSTVTTNSGALSNGGTLSVVDSGTPGNLSINENGTATGLIGLTLSGTNNLNFQLDQAALDGIAVNGNLLVSDSGSTNLINILTAGDTSLTAGDYPLISAPNGDVTGGGTAIFQFASNNATSQTVTVGSQHYVLSLSTTTTAETLNVAPVNVGPATLTWTNAAATGLWNTTDSNWNNSTANATYSDGSNVIFNDSNGGNYSVTLNTVVSPGSIAVNNSAGNYTIAGSGSIAGTASLTKSGSGKITIGTSGTSLGAVSITAGTVQLGTSTGLTTITSLAISGNGTLDVNNNHIIINYGSGTDPASSIAALLATGYNGGAWNGAGGITSTAAAANAGVYGVGWADSADAGNPAGLATGTLEIKYTLLGDADLNGIVNGIDFGIVAANFNKGVTGWDQGDFDYNNIVSGIDFGDLAANFNKGASGAADWAALVQFAEANGLMADVPEPASIGLVGVAAAGLLARRRRRRE